jgi:hypothetical protein
MEMHMMYQSQKLYHLLQWLKTSSFVVLVEGILGTSIIFYSLRQNEAVNLWTICGACLVVICIWQVQARFPDRDWM